MAKPVFLLFKMHDLACHVHVLDIFTVDSYINSLFWKRSKIIDHNIMHKSVHNHKYFFQSPFFPGMYACSLTCTQSEATVTCKTNFHDFLNFR